MRISVWDTYVRREDGLVMHFDILVPSTMDNENIVFSYGKAYLADKPFDTHGLTSKECKFCHMEQATQEVMDEINKKGYYIVEMENCQPTHSKNKI